ncbi:MAG: DUF1799 domain-containing protein [Thiobacillaceae bacterium]|jgi:hypothetical protein|nr:DUF1799 domain-containing protein [Thiobacillaceae bacterium]
MYRRGDGDTCQALNQLGLPAALAKHFTPEAVEVFPENWPAVRVFDALGTQWRMSMAGPIGLDYAALPMVFDLLGIEDRAAVFEDLRTMERAALEELTRK